MKYFTLKHNLKTTMRFSASKIYDSNYKEYKSKDFKVENSIRSTFNEPLSIVLHESTSFYKKNGKLTDILDVSFPVNIPCISNRTRSLFESMNLPLEYFDVQIKGKKIEILTGYQLAKMVGKRIFCLNHKDSIATYDDEYLDSITKLVFDQSKIPNDTKIFLLGELYEYYPWITEEIMLEIKKNNLTGFEFLEVGEYKQL